MKILLIPVFIELQNELVIKVLKAKQTKSIIQNRHDKKTRHIEEISYDVSEQQKDRTHACSFFSLLLDDI